VLQKYHESKQKLIDVVTRLIEAREVLFPIRVGTSKIGVDYLESILESLGKDAFVVSICGQIKAGKSTLLNALLFGRPFLPSKVTPETAVLTKIHYGELFEAKITFYSVEEWSSLTENTEFKKCNSGYLEKLITKEVDPSEYLGRTISVENKNDLEKYIAAGGLFTLLVKQVEISHPSVPKYGLVFVDTPGLNDPNIVRSKITLDWVSKSDAVLFLLHSRGVDGSDYNFMNESMMGIREESFILVLNRMDELNSNGLERVKKYILDALSSGAIAEKNLINFDTDIIAVSSLGALFHRSDESNWNSDLIWHYNKMKAEKSEYISEDGHFDVLERAITKKLVDNKGRNVIRTNVNKIRTLFSTRGEYLRMERERLCLQLDIISNGVTDIRVKIDDLDEKRRAIDKTYSLINDRFSANLQIAKNELFTDILVAISEVKSKAEQTINSEKPLGEISRNLPFIIKGGLTDLLLSSDSRISMTLKSINTQMQDAVLDVRDDLTKALNKEHPGLLAFINYQLNLENLDQSIQESLARATHDQFRICVERVWGFLWTKKEKSKGNLSDQVAFLLKETKKGIQDRINRDVFDSIKKMVDTIRKDIEHFQDVIMEDLRAIEEEGKSKEQATDEFKMKLASLKETEEKLELIRDKEYEELEHLNEYI